MAGVSLALLIAARPDENAVAEPDSAGGALPFESTWPAILPLVDRPFLQHVVEKLVALGIRELHVALSNQPERVEALLGDGERWGISIRYHLIRESDAASDAILAVMPRLISTLPLSDASASGSPSLLIASSEALPSGFELPLAADGCLEVVDSSGAPAGWGIAPLVVLHEILATSATVTAGFWSQLRDRPDTTLQSCETLLKAGSPAELLASQQIVLLGGCPELLRTGAEIEPGINLSRNVAIHPSAVIVAPVFIGEDCQIGPMVRIGPNAVVGSGCLIDAGATASDSLILGGSYVGEEVDLRDAIVDRNRLVSVWHGTSVVITDSFLLGDLQTPGANELMRGVLSRLAALVLFIALWPVLLVTALWLRLSRSGPVIRRIEIAARPQVSGHPGAIMPETSVATFCKEGDSPDGAAHFILCLLPALPAAVAGRIRLAGLVPRSASEITALPPDWAALYRAEASGLITETFVVHGPAALPDESYTAEAYYAATGGIRRDIQLFLRYIGRLFAPRRQDPSALTAAKAR